MESIDWSGGGCARLVSVAWGYPADRTAPFFGMGRIGQGHGAFDEGIVGQGGDGSQSRRPVGRFVRGRTAHG